MSLRPAARSWPGMLLALLLLLGCAGILNAAPYPLPPKPDQYVTDQAGVLDQGTIAALDRQLAQFERDTTNQLIVAIYPALPDDAELYQYCTFTAQSWQAGQKGRNNGVVLFVFVNSHKLYIAVGRGLEGALPDALCNEIRTRIMNPRFRQGAYASGISAGVNAIIAATKGEYRGTGSTRDQTAKEGPPGWVVFIVLIIIFIVISRSRSYGAPFIYTGGGWGGGGGGGGFSGGGGGGFSGGGGSFGGGGAGGSW